MSEFAFTTAQIDRINTSLERALSISELLVECGPADREEAAATGRGSLTAVFQILVDELNGIDEVMRSIAE